MAPPPGFSSDASSQRRSRLRVLARSPRSVLLLGQTVLAVAAVRVALSLLPSRLVLRTVDRLSRRALRRARHGPDAALPPHRLGGLVRAAARRVPAATCLTQALAGQMLLARHGYSSRLQIGVARDEGGAFRAHAWLEAAAGIVLGGEVSGQFTPMPDIRSRLR
jgi:hypothetical protein